MPLLLESQEQMLRALCGKYDWKSHVKLVHRISSVPPTITRRRGKSGSRKLDMPPIQFSDDDVEDKEEEMDFALHDITYSDQADMMTNLQNSLENVTINDDFIEDADDDGDEGYPGPICTEILSTAQKLKRTRKSIMEMKSFSRNRGTMAIEMFEKYNTKVFKDQLPKDLQIIWSKNLTTTAGRALPKKIELSVKVLDTPLRLRDTLLHEMCHVAVFNLMPGKKVKPHGKEFRYWASKVTSVIPDAVVGTCHSYEIFKPYQFQCTSDSCAQTYGMHSKKGLDLTRYISC